MRQLTANPGSDATLPAAAPVPRAVRTRNVGSVLRRARRARGLELADIEHALHIREQHLRALEANRFDEISGTAYARLFLREYAEYLGLDGDRVLELVGDRLADQERVHEEPEESMTPEGEAAPTRVLVWLDRGFGRIPTGLRRWAWLVGALALVVVLVLRSGGGSQPAAFEPSGSSHAPRQHTAAVAATPPDSRLIAAPATTNPAPVSTTRTAQVELAAARGDCWILVRAGSSAGAVIFEGILRQGGAVRFGGRTLWLRAGAPWNLVARVNGRVQHGLPTRPSDLLVTSSGVKPAA